MECVSGQGMSWKSSGIPVRSCKNAGRQRRGFRSDIANRKAEVKKMYVLWVLVIAALIVYLLASVVKPEWF